MLTISQLIQRIRDQDTSPDGSLGKQAVASVVDMQIQHSFRQLLADGLWKGVTGLGWDIRLILLQRNDADEPPPDLVLLIRDSVWSLFEEAGDPEPAPDADHPRSPADPSSERLKLEGDRKRFRIDDQWIHYGSDRATEFLQRLIDAKGAPVAGKNLVKGNPRSGEHRADRIHKGLPQAIRDIIEVKRGGGGGYHIKPEYFS